MNLVKCITDLRDSSLIITSKIYPDYINYNALASVVSIDRIRRSIGVFDGGQDSYLLYLSRLATYLIFHDLGVPFPIQGSQPFFHISEKNFAYTLQEKYYYPKMITYLLKMFASSQKTLTVWSYTTTGLRQIPNSQINSEAEGFSISGELNLDSRVKFPIASQLVITGSTTTDHFYQDENFQRTALLYISYFYRNRDGGSLKDFEQIKRTASQLLQEYRLRFFN